MPADHTKLLDELRASVGEGNLLTSEADCAPYVTGERYGHGRALFVARPTRSEEVSGIVRACRRHGVTLIPQGGNTGLVGASVPDATGEQGVVSLERLKAHCEIDAESRTVTVSAGMRLAELNRRLEAFDLCFPIDLGADPAIGGMVATNTGGARYLRYGDVRQNTLGLEVVLGNGEVLDLMTRVRKNNTGFDLKHLFIGSGGAAGIVTKAVLAVHPVLRETATALVVPDSKASVMTLLAKTEAAFGSDLTSFEGMSGTAMDSVFRHRLAADPFTSSSTPAFAILIELGAATAAAQGPALQERLDDFIMDLLADGAMIADAYAQHPEALWAIRHSITEAIRHDGTVVAMDIAVPRSRVFACRAALSVAIRNQSPEARICDFGHIADGGIHFNIVLPASIDIGLLPEVAAALRRIVYEIVVNEFAGSFSSEHGIGPANVAYYQRYKSPEHLKISDSIQELLSPGKRLGSISLGTPLA